MGYRDRIFAIIALALSSVALVGILYTDDYSQAAQAEARGYEALLCANVQHADLAVGAAVTQ